MGRDNFGKVEDDSLILDCKIGDMANLCFVFAFEIHSLLN